MITIYLRQAALLPADPSQDQSENQNQDRTQIENQDGAQIENQDGTQIENQIERVTSWASAEVPMRAEASPREATMRTIALVLYLSYTSEPSILIVTRGCPGVFFNSLSHAGVQEYVQIYCRTRVSRSIFIFYIEHY